MINTLSKRRLLLLLLALALIVALALFLSRDTTSPDAKYRAGVRTRTWSHRLNVAEDKWPELLVRLFRVRQFRAKYNEQAEQREKALYDSGYLVHLRADITNTTTEIFRIVRQLKTVFPNGDGGTYISVSRDHVILVCRTNDEALCRKVLNITNASILAGKSQ